LHPGYRADVQAHCASELKAGQLAAKLGIDFLAGGSYWITQPSSNPATSAPGKRFFSSKLQQLQQGHMMLIAHVIPLSEYSYKEEGANMAFSRISGWDARLVMRMHIYVSRRTYLRLMMVAGGAGDIRLKYVPG
jgi:hypothetical protein